MDVNFPPMKSGFAFCLALANRMQWKWHCALLSLGFKRLFYAIAFFLAKLSNFNVNNLGLSAGWETRGAEMNLHSWDHSRQIMNAQQLGSSPQTHNWTQLNRKHHQLRPAQIANSLNYEANGNCLKLPSRVVYYTMKANQSTSLLIPLAWEGVALRTDGLSEEEGQGWKKKGFLRRKRGMILVGKQSCTF